MGTISNFIDNLIPYRFKITFDLETKARAFITSQIIVGGLLILIGAFFTFVERDVVEAYLNTIGGLYLLFTVPAIRLFKHFESHVNLVAIGAYIIAFLFIINSGGIFADETFWLALIIAITINYGRRSHAVLWTVVVGIFLVALYLLQSNGLELEPDQLSPTERITTLFSFFALLVIVTYGYSRINNKRNQNQLKIISDHKRLLKERDDLLSVVAHDMKSPSRRIEGLINIFDTSNLTKDQLDILQMLKATADESKQLINDLIEATSFQAHLQIESINVNNFLEEIVNGFVPIAEKKDIDLIFKRKRKKVILESSVPQLRRVLDNLISNAIKFSNSYKTVEIYFEIQNDQIKISVKDQGPGFTDEDIPKMYQMFQKLSAQPTGDESSSGLGLSIVKNLTKLLNGKINFMTERGKGSTFILVLPKKFIYKKDPKTA